MRITLASTVQPWLNGRCSLFTLPLKSTSGTVQPWLDAKDNQHKHLKIYRTKDTQNGLPKSRVPFPEKKCFYSVKSHIVSTALCDKKGKQPKLVSLLTNDFDMPLETIVAIYLRRWQIESLFKQTKQNFPLRYFYGESANAIKIQIWVTLIANLLLSVLQSKLKRRWSFSGLATIVRIVLMYYLNPEKFLNQPDADLNIMLAEASEPPPQEPNFD